MEFINFIPKIEDFSMNTHVDIQKKCNNYQSSELILQSKCKNNHVLKPRIEITLGKCIAVGLCGFCNNPKSLPAPQQSG